jgi:hypothetical protein
MLGKLINADVISGRGRGGAGDIHFGIAYRR